MRKMHLLNADSVICNDDLAFFQTDFYPSALFTVAYAIGRQIIKNLPDVLFNGIKDQRSFDAKFYIFSAACGESACAISLATSWTDTFLKIRSFSRSARDKRSTSSTTFSIRLHSLLIV